MELGQSWALEAGREHSTQKSIFPDIEDHRLVEMQHGIVRIGRAVVHGQRRYREATGGGGGGGGGGKGAILVQNMLTEGRGEHVLWSSEGGGEKHVWGGSNPKGRVHGWYRWIEALGSLGRIFVSWLRLASVPVGFSLYPALRGIDRSTGLTRGLFLDWASAAFGDGERRGSGELSEDNSSSVGRSMSSGTAASLPFSG